MTNKYLCKSLTTKIKKNSEEQTLRRSTYFPKFPGFIIKIFKSIQKQIKKFPIPTIRVNFISGIPCHPLNKAISYFSYAVS